MSNPKNLMLSRWLASALQWNTADNFFKKLRGSLLIVLGYLLSPLCWWNDLVFNLPIAYGIGYLCSLIAHGLLIPGAIAGYWLSNVAGILLMQAGCLDVVQEQSKQRNLKQELLTGALSATGYTLVIVLLLQFKVLDALDISAVLSSRK
jgi:hypothetical protein